VRDLTAPVPPVGENADASGEHGIPVRPVPAQHPANARERRMDNTTRDDLQRVRQLTTELYALTVEMSGFARTVRLAQQDGCLIIPIDVGKAEVMLGRIAQGATLLRDEARRLSLEPEPAR
jgi:hypothetical protein